MGASAPSVSTLSDVIRRVEALFSLIGDGTPILVGSKHRDNLGPGAPPCIVFVPDEEGEMGPPLKLNAGYIASWSHGCGVFVIGVEPGDDEGRFEPAYEIAARVVAALKACDPGHVEVGVARPKDESPLKAGLPGAVVRLSFVYRRNIPQNKAIERAAKELVAVSPPDPDRPQGSTGNTFTMTTTATPTESRS